MCLILMAWQTHPDYSLVVAANRDEYFARPSAPAAFWEQTPNLLAGRDLEAGGTWLGITRQQRFAALTNFREGGKPRVDAPSRGKLVADFLAGSDDPENYFSELAERGHEYNGFNLFFGDAQRLGYFTNRGSDSRWLSPGIYGLSNHLLDSPWPKLSSAKKSFAEALAQLPQSEPFFSLLADRDVVADDSLPQTGVSLEWERILSSIFVVSPNYGTRASTLLTLNHSGETTLIERSFGENAILLGETRTRFQSSAISTDV